MNQSKSYSKTNNKELLIAGNLTFNQFRNLNINEAQIF